jgi:hypothetical protein
MFENEELFKELIKERGLPYPIYFVLYFVMSFSCERSVWYERKNVSIGAKF